MKINTVDTVIQDWREGQNIFRRPSVELLVREISHLKTQLRSKDINIQSLRKTMNIINRIFIQTEGIQCTADGKYPDVGRMVVYEAEGSAWIGGFTKRDDLGSHWFEGEEAEYYPHFIPIYWFYLNNLKEKYEKEKHKETD